MKKNGQLRKLNLNRETLLPLQADELDDVNGGTGALCRASVRLCSRISRSVLESISLLTNFFCNANGGQQGGGQQGGGQQGQ